jgi:hypothetical protein
MSNKPPTQIAGVQYTPTVFYLIDVDGRYHMTTKKAVKVYATRAHTDKNIKDWSVASQVTTLHFHGAYSPLSKEDIEALSQPTGFTGLLRGLE